MRSACGYSVANLDRCDSAVNNPLHPPALDLPDAARARWTSLIKVIREPSQNWPREILERPLVVGKVGDRTLALIADPGAARMVLMGDEDRFPKWAIYDRTIGRGVGPNSVSVARGEQWRRLRQAISPIFRPDRTRELFAEIRTAAEEAVQGWARIDCDGRLDVALETTRITLSIIWRILFPDVAKVFGDATVDEAARRIDAAQLAHDMTGVADQLTWLAQQGMGDASSEEGSKGPPWVRGPSTAAGRGGRALSREETFDNVRTLLGAGHETTALTLAWAFWLIGQDLDVQRRLHAEIDSVLGDLPLEFDQIGRLVFTGQVLRETLRLYPPAPVTVRQAAGALQLAGTELPAGSVLAVCIYALHRHRLWWADPDAFRPDRFAPGSGEPRHEFAFLPFSAGRHVCIAGQFGWIEAMTIFVTLLRRLQLTTNPTIRVRPRVGVTLRPDGPLQVSVRRR